MADRERSSGILATIVIAISVIIALAIGIIILSNFQVAITPMTTTLETSLQTSMNATFSTAYTAWNIGNILPLMLFAALIISAVAGVGALFSREGA